MLTAEDRRQAPHAGNEIDTLTGTLNHHRDTLRWKCAGLTDEQMRTTMHPTDMTLAGLVLHLTMVEAWWFNLTFAGGLTQPDWLEVAELDDYEWEWSHAADFTSAQLWAWFDEAVAVSGQVVADSLAGEQGLDALAVDPDSSVSMRWLLVHMIEEYARHNGHADLLRQSIDGSTGV